MLSTSQLFSSSVNSLSSSMPQFLTESFLSLPLNFFEFFVILDNYPLSDTWLVFFPSRRLPSHLDNGVLCCAEVFQFCSFVHYKIVACIAFSGNEEMLLLSLRSYKAFPERINNFDFN